MGGKAPSVQKVDVLDPAQRQALQSILNVDLQGLFDPQQQQQFFQAQVAEPTLRQFQEEVIPMLNEQFIGQGAASSSGLNRALAKRATDLQSNLAAQLSGFQQQNRQNQLELIARALGLQSFQASTDPGKPGLLGPLFGIGGAAIGGKFGGTAGAKIGAGLGGSLGSSF